MAAKKAVPEVTVERINQVRVTVPCDLNDSYGADPETSELDLTEARLEIKVLPDRVIVARSTKGVGGFDSCDDLTILSREHFDKLIEAVK